MKYSFLLLSVFFSSFLANNIHAQEQEFSKQKNVITFAVGSYEITTLSEGQDNGDTKILIDASPGMLEKYAPEGKFPTATNAFLVKTPDKTILIDAGYGRKLFENLQSRGVTAEKIDVILITHMHGDHIGGLLKDGSAAFPNAEIYIAKAEYDYWMSDLAKGGGVQARTVIKAYQEKLQLFVPTEIETGGYELFPGVKAIATCGHTPGHTVFLIESDSAKVLVWGDLTHAMAVQMSHPEIAVTYDIDPRQAIVSRKKIFDHVATNKIPIAGMHIPFPAVGRVEKTTDGKYSFKTFSLSLGL